MRTFIGALLILFSIQGRCGSYSDLWYNPNESGWGVNLIQQYDTIFATLFVYGNDGRTSWYVAPGLRTSAANVRRFTGDLFETTGPWFGTAFNPSAVTARRVGALTFTGGGDGISGTIEFQVDGVSTSKSVQRQTWTSMPSTGSYLSQIISLIIPGECTSGIALSNYDDIRVNDAGTVGFFDSTGNQACQIAGAISQDGQLKKLIGSISCLNGFTGNAAIRDWRVEGSTAVLAGPSPLTMTGNITITGTTGCFKFYQFAGVIR